MIYTQDELTITDEKENEIFREANFLYKNEDSEKIKVGSIWYSGENREQYNLNPDLEYKFTFKNSKGSLKSILDIIDLESEKISRTSRYNLFDIDRTTTIEVSYTTNNMI